MHLICFFLPSGESIDFVLPSAYNLINIFFCLSNHSHSNSEQGCHNDLIKKSCQASPPTVGTHPVGDGLRFDDYWLTSGISKSDHYPPLIHSHVLRGSSCRAGSVPPTNHQNLQPLSSNDVFLPRSNAWFHVYSKSNANSSLCTQCAAVAHLPVDVSSSVHYRQFYHAKNKF